jgi:hypothetical protein
MQQKGVIRTIFLLLGFILSVFGCATGKNQVADRYIGLKIQSIPEGICLTFDNIPPEVHRLDISILDHSTSVYPEMDNDRHEFATANITGNSLELVKKTGKVVFPFTHAGHKYSINVHASFSYDTLSGDRLGGLNWIYTVFVAENGNYYENYLELIINESKTSVILSSEPVFPAEMHHDPYNYRFDVILKENEPSIFSPTSTFSPRKSVVGKHWEFAPDMDNQLKERRWLQSGDYPTFITAYCNIIYDNIPWEVEIAKTLVFVYSYKTERQVASPPIDKINMEYFTKNKNQIGIITV